MKGEGKAMNINQQVWVAVAFHYFFMCWCFPFTIGHTWVVVGIMHGVVACEWVIVLLGTSFCLWLCAKEEGIYYVYYI